MVGFGSYAALPPLPVCTRSADAIGTALRPLGFDITDSRDASGGSVAAAIGRFADRLAEGPPIAVVYVCGYVDGLDGRPFVLPVSAQLARPSDVLTQGLLAKIFLDLPRNGNTPALVLIDAVALPGSGPNGLGALLHGATLRPGVFAAAATTADAGGQVTALAAAAARAIGAPDADAGGVLTALQAKLDPTLSLATAGAAPDKALLVPAPAAPPQAQAAPPPPAIAPPPAAPSPPTAVTEPAAAAVPILDEAARRRVQSALKQLGLYPGLVDGTFGPATTAAIRRFQTVRGADPTGQLDAGQARLLLDLAGKP